MSRVLARRPEAVVLGEVQWRAQARQGGLQVCAVVEALQQLVQPRVELPERRKETGTGWQGRGGAEGWGRPAVPPPPPLSADHDTSTTATG